MKTYSPSAEDAKAAVSGGLSMPPAKLWDALPVKLRKILRGKHKPTFSPHVDGGDFVIVTNCERVVVTGNKLDDVHYYRHSRYPGGLKSRTMREQMDRFPDRVIYRGRQGNDAQDASGPGTDEEAARLRRQRTSACCSDAQDD